jgi:hypothetical protein
MDQLTPMCLLRLKSFLVLAAPIAALALLLSGCVTDYYSYQGGGPMIGQGGASKRIDGIDIWVRAAGKKSGKSGGLKGG